MDQGLGGADNVRPRQGAIPLVAIAFCLIFARVIGSLVLPLYDDAFITFRYARNLAAGHGLLYNAGEWVLGLTCPLFGVLCAIPFTLKLPMPATVVAVNILCDAATLLLTLHVLRRQSDPAQGKLFAILFALSPISTRVCAGGMEMNLYLLISLAAIVFGLRSQWPSAILFAAGACLLRPEGVLLLGILLLRAGLEGGVRKALRIAALAGVVLVPALVSLWITYGSPVPQSLRAKATLIEHAHLSPLQILLQLVAADPLMVLCLPFAAWGALRAVRDRGTAFQRVVGWWGLAYLGAYMAGRPNVYSWYGEPVYFAVLLMGALGAHDALHRLRWPSPRALDRLLTAAITLPILVWGGTLLRGGPSGVTTHVFQALDHWGRLHDVEHASFMAADIGALGYFTNGRIYDQAGLVWPEALQYRTPEQIIARYRPDYLYMNVNQATWTFMNSSPWRSVYRPVARFSKSGRQDFDLHDAAAGVWLQDYVLFARSGEHAVPSPPDSGALTD
ncbi:MAG: hypothetical protein ABI565_09865 [Vicinamibacteria bacterium]